MSKKDSWYSVIYLLECTPLLPPVVGTCSADDDQHCTVFDGKRFNVHGVCSHIMMQYKASGGSETPVYTVEVNMTLP